MATNPLQEYIKQKLLGKGAFGVVYLAKDKLTDEEVVIKIINTDNLSVKELQNSMQEAELLKMLDNPFVVKFKKLFQFKNTLSIVMEYADGGDLAKRIKQASGKYFSEEQILEWFCQILLAIKDIHAKNIIHRDIKAQNIFLTKTGLVKIGDFGVSTQTSSCASTVVGTPYYLSPEIINGAQYDSKTDIWSLGVLLYELCCLDYPFKVPNNSLAALALKILKGKYSPLPKQYSADLGRLIAAMLSINSKGRPSVDQLINTKLIKSFISGSNLIKVALGSKIDSINLTPAPATVTAAAKLPLKKPASGISSNAGKVPLKKPGTGVISNLHNQRTLKRDDKDRPTHPAATPAPLQELKRKVVDKKPTPIEKPKGPKTAPTMQKKPVEAVDSLILDSGNTAEEELAAAKKLLKKQEIEAQRKQMREEIRKKKRESQNSDGFDVQIFTAAGKANIEPEASANGDRGYSSADTGTNDEPDYMYVKQPPRRPFGQDSPHQGSTRGNLNIDQPPLLPNKSPWANKPTKSKQANEVLSGPPPEEPYNPAGKRLPFGGATKNDRFLDKDHSADGIEIFVKGAPPPKKLNLDSQSGSQDLGNASGGSDFNSAQFDFRRRETGSASYADLVPSPKLRNFSSVQQESIPSASPRLKQASYSTLPSGGLERDSTRGNLEPVLPLKPGSMSKAVQEPAGSVSRNSDNSNSDKGSPQKLLKFVPSKEASLAGGNSPRPSNTGTPPTEAAFKIPLVLATQVYPQTDSIEDREGTFNDVIENVSKIDTKKCLRDQISSSYAVLEQKRYEIEKAIGEKDFNRVYSRIKTQIKTEGSLDRFIESRTNLYMEIDPDIAMDIANLVLIEANLEVNERSAKK